MNQHPAVYVVRRCDGTIAVVQLSSTADHYLRAIAREVRSLCDESGDVVIAGPLVPLAMSEYRREVEKEREDVRAWVAAQRLNLRQLVSDAVARHRARKLNAEQRAKVDEIAKNPDPRD